MPDPTDPTPPRRPEHILSSDSYRAAPEGEGETYRLSDPPPAWSEPDLPVRPVELVRPEDRRSPVRRADPERSAWLALMGFNLIVFASSVCVMMLELAASRLIAKHVGSSLYTWTSVIGVVLAGITAGNWLGGWLADQPRPRRTLAWTFLVASISCWLVLWLDQVVPTMGRPSNMNWPMWVLFVVGTMFFLPAMALGTISPIVASLALATGSRTGTTVGNVYAWGAMGSIVGTFITGFYLIDVFGTRSIVGLTSASLAVMALLVATGNRFFRVGVVVGWMQVLGWSLALAGLTDASVGTAAEFTGRVWSWRSSTESASARQAEWREFGLKLGRQLHEVGLTLRLRDDRPDEYHDDSSYSYINVASQTAEDGESIKYLRLDKLIHSYYHPGDPTALYYDYEKVYAAITEQLAPAPETATAVKVPAFPARDELVAKLPEGLTWDAAAEELRLAPRAQPIWSDLRRLAPEGDYWDAVETLRAETNRASWGGFTSVPLKMLPPGVEIPVDFERRVRFDPGLEVLTAYEPVTRTDAARLVSRSPSGPWAKAVEDLRSRTRRVNTFFVGGGGFIFPRWIEANFPGSEHIVVAELDPAVLATVESQLGLDPEQTSIETRIGDARNVVDDLLREDERRAAAGEPAVLYDFVYGDAFNDFSVPWHLTTKEFSEKIGRLMTPRGAYLVNLIDIYPRTVYPGTRVGEAEVILAGPPPAGLFPEPILQKTPSRGRGWSNPLEIRQATEKTYTLRARSLISEGVENDLRLRDGGTSEWRTAVHDLAEKTRAFLPYPGPLPKGLTFVDDSEKGWVAASAPFEHVEIYRIDEDDVVLGIRGILSPAQRDALVQLAPQETEWTKAVQGLATKSRQTKFGRFLGRYLNTARHLFPNVYLYSSTAGIPSDDRDTYVIACTRVPLPGRGTLASDEYAGTAFAAYETIDGKPRLSGQMESLLELAEGYELTDDFAPVDNLLMPLFMNAD